eukprot:4036968-Pleurochrysis_carterae.AAC.1
MKSFVGPAILYLPHALANAGESAVPRRLVRLCRTLPNCTGRRCGSSARSARSRSERSQRRQRKTARRPALVCFEGGK